MRKCEKKAISDQSKVRIYSNNNYNNHNHLRYKIVFKEM